MALEAILVGTKQAKSFMTGTVRDPYTMAQTMSSGVGKATNIPLVTLYDSLNLTTYSDHTLMALIAVAAGIVATAPLKAAFHMKDLYKNPKIERSFREKLKHVTKFQLTDAKIGVPSYLLAIGSIATTSMITQNPIISLGLAPLVPGIGIGLYKNNLRKRLDQGKKSSIKQFYNKLQDKIYTKILPHDVVVKMAPYSHKMSLYF